MGCPEAAFHTRAVRSALAVNTRVPSALNTACMTRSLCCIGGVMALPDSVSQIRALSSLAVTTRRPSVLKATAVIWYSCSTGWPTRAPVAVSHIRKTRSFPAVAMRLPSGLSLARVISERRSSVRSWAVSAFHTRAVPPKSTLRISRPSAENSP
jgi:hypothetical protein